MPPRIVDESAGRGEFLIQSRLPDSVQVTNIAEHVTVVSRAAHTVDIGC